MDYLKLQFPNSEGATLSARLYLPVDQHPYTYAIFAHCFTCNKNLTAIRNIARSLTQNGVAVLSFDFTGLGESEGEFSDTSFSLNVEDIQAANKYLTEKFKAPELLIGHSLGGAAVLFAAKYIDSIKAIVTIGAPADPEHVSHLFAREMKVIEQKGEAVVSIGGRSFTIRQDFINDLMDNGKLYDLNKLDKGLLIMHSPQDKVVEIDNALMLYKKASHPKSFISLDEADHLLSSKKDSVYAGTIIAAWISKYIAQPESVLLKSDMQVVARTESDSLTTDIKIGKHGLTADEPESVGGNDFGPTPYELLSASLGTCTSMTLQLYARRKAWPLKAAIVHIDHSKKHIEDIDNVDRPGSKIDTFSKRIELQGQLSEEQKKRLMEIADRCPVHRTLSGEIKIETKLD